MLNCQRVGSSVYPDYFWKISSIPSSFADAQRIWTAGIGLESFSDAETGQISAVADGVSRFSAPKMVSK
jgi:hypothetical protein